MDARSTHRYDFHMGHNEGKVIRHEVVSRKTHGSAKAGLGRIPVVRLRFSTASKTGRQVWADVAISD